MKRKLFVIKIKKQREKKEVQVEEQYMKKTDDTEHQ
jgi:hypothetical protein